MILCIAIYGVVASGGEVAESPTGFFVVGLGGLFTPGVGAGLLAGSPTGFFLLGRAVYPRRWGGATRRIALRAFLWWGYYIPRHDVSTEKVNAVALKKLPATLQVVGAVLYFCPLVNVRELRCLFGGGES